MWCITKSVSITYVKLQKLQSIFLLFFLRPLNPNRKWFYPICVFNFLRKILFFVLLIYFFSGMYSIKPLSFSPVAHLFISLSVNWHAPVILLYSVQLVFAKIASGVSSSGVHSSYNGNNCDQLFLILKVLTFYHALFKFVTASFKL